MRVDCGPVNEFYTAFDVELLDRRMADYRTPFQQDRDRIIYTSAFRRLQAKTQVFSVGEYDFYRNRLTHSIEVAQIGRSICSYLLGHDPALGASFHVDADLVEAVCLAHDLGHPPFGHAGERALHDIMRPHGGFEGNAQTLRLMTETVFSRRGRRTGIRPTRALVDGVMKYKTRRGQLPDPDNHFLYDDQAAYVAFVFGGRTPPAELFPGPALDGFRSLECEIMDWADDTAYSLNDLADGIRAGFLTRRRVEDWAERESAAGADADSLEALLAMIGEDDLEVTVSSWIGDFIEGCRLIRRENFLSDLTHRYAYGLAVDPALRRRAALFGRLSRELVFTTAQLQQLEFKGRMMLRRLWESYREAYLSADGPKLALLPAHRERLVVDAEGVDGKARLICDYLAGMTDAFAVRTYKRLFEPEYGSIVDIV